MRFRTMMTLGLLLLLSLSMKPSIASTAIELDFSKQTCMINRSIDYRLGSTLSPEYGDKMPLGFLTALYKGLSAGLIGGVTSGLSKRIDAQIGGKKAAQYGGQSQGAMQLIGNDAFRTNQTASQGQSEGFQADLAQSRMLHDSYERGQQRQHEREMLNAELSRNGPSPNDGQVPWWAAPAAPAGAQTASGATVPEIVADPVGHFNRQLESGRMD